jgi:hypothetical protein
MQTQGSFIRSGLLPDSKPGGRYRATPHMMQARMKIETWETGAGSH